MVVTRESLNGAVEFDCPFRVVDGCVVHEWILHEPEVMLSEADVAVSGGWSVMSGYTGQHGYRGAVMHPSEFLGGRMAGDVLAMAAEEPTTVFVVVEVRDVDGSFPVDGPIGWAVVYRPA